MPAGTRSDWDVANGRWNGHVDLARTFLPGTEMILRNVVNGAQIQSPCTLKVMEPYPQYTVFLSPASLTVNLGQEGIITATLDKPSIGLGSEVWVTAGPNWVISLNGGTPGTHATVMFGKGELSAPIRVKGVKVGGPSTVTIKLAESVGGATASATVKVKFPVQRQRTTP